MADLNRVCLLGHMGKDPEKRYFPSGDPIVSFSVATTEKWKDKASGDARERTEWHLCEVTGKLADIVSKMGFKGQRVYLEGKKVTEEYQKDGQTARIVKIKIDGFGGRFDALTFRVDGSTDEQMQRPPSQSTKKAPPKKAANGGWGDESDDSIPF